MIPPDLLEILCCPETHQALRLADDRTVAALNGEIARQRVKNRAGETVMERIDGALEREDGRFFYVIRGRMPVMLVGESIPASAIR